MATVLNVTRSSSDSASDPARDYCTFSFVLKRFIIFDVKQVQYSEYHQYDGCKYRLAVSPQGDLLERRTAVILERALLSVGKVQDVVKRPVRFWVTIPHPNGNEKIQNDAILPTNLFSDGWDNFTSPAELKREGYLRPDGAVAFDVKIAAIDVSKCDLKNGTAPKPGCQRVSLAALLQDPDKSLADVRLRGREDTSPVIRVHRCLLSASYDFFGTLLSGNFAENQSDVVRLNDISGKGLQIVINFAYGIDLPDDLSEEEDTLLDVWTFATVRLMEDLAKKCSSYARDTVKKHNLVSRCRLAISLNDETCKYSMAREVHRVKQSSPVYAELLKFSIDEMESLLCDMPATVHALKFAEGWLEQDATRYTYGSRIFEAFQIDDMAVKDLRQPELYAFCKDLHIY